MPSSKRIPTIGVLAVQGAFAAHVAMAKKAGARAVAVRTGGQVSNIDALILPGGESTVVRRHLAWANLHAEVSKHIADGKPVLGTCAGMIVLAEAGDEKHPGLDVLDIDVERNGFGPQSKSFEAPVTVAKLTGLDAGGSEQPGVFIRAPRVTRVGDGVEVLATVAPGSSDPEPCAVVQGNIIATSFHPELADSLWLHTWLCARTTNRVS